MARTSFQSQPFSSRDGVRQRAAEDGEQLQANHQPGGKSPRPRRHRPSGLLQRPWRASLARPRRAGVQFSKAPSLAEFPCPNQSKGRCRDPAKAPPLVAGASARPCRQGEPGQARTPDAPQPLLSSPGTGQAMLRPPPSTLRPPRTRLRRLTLRCRAQGRVFSPFSDQHALPVHLPAGPGAGHGARDVGSAGCQHAAAPDLPPGERTEGRPSVSKGPPRQLGSEEATDLLSPAAPGSSSTNGLCSAQPRSGSAFPGFALASAD